MNVLVGIKWLRPLRRQHTVDPATHRIVRSIRIPQGYTHVVHPKCKPRPTPLPLPTSTAKCFGLPCKKLGRDRPKAAYPSARRCSSAAAKFLAGGTIGACRKTIH